MRSRKTFRSSRQESFQEQILRVLPAGILQILEQARKLKSSAGGGSLQSRRLGSSGTGFTGRVKSIYFVILSEAKNLSGF